MSLTTTFLQRGILHVCESKGTSYNFLITNKNRYIAIFGNVEDPEDAKQLTILINEKLSNSVLKISMHDIPFWFKNTATTNMIIGEKQSCTIVPGSDQVINFYIVCVQGPIETKHNNINLIINSFPQYDVMDIFVGEIVVMKYLIVKKIIGFNITVGILDKQLCGFNIVQILKKIIEKLFNIINISIIMGPLVYFMFDDFRFNFINTL